MRDVVMPRRTLLAGAFATVATRACAGWAPGTVGEAGLPTVLGALGAVEQGTGAKRISIMVSPGCDHSAAMFDAVRGRSDVTRVRWVPFTGGNGVGTEPLARVLAERTPEALRTFLAGGAGGARPDAAAWAAAVRQDAMVDRAVARMLWAATGRPVAAPTTVYVVEGGSVRVVRGSMPPDVLDAVLEAAA